MPRETKNPRGHQVRIVVGIDPRPTADRGTAAVENRSSRRPAGGIRHLHIRQPGEEGRSGDNPRTDLRRRQREQGWPVRSAAHPRLRDEVPRPSSAARLFVVPRKNRRAGTWRNVQPQPQLAFEHSLGDQQPGQYIGRGADLRTHCRDRGATPSAPFAGRNHFRLIVSQRSGRPRCHRPRRRSRLRLRMHADSRPAAQELRRPHGRPAAGPDRSGSEIGARPGARLMRHASPAKSIARRGGGTAHRKPHPCGCIPVEEGNRWNAKRARGVPAAGQWQASGNLFPPRPGSQ